MDDESPLTRSTFFKVARALDGDDNWSLRLGMAFEILGVTDTRPNRIQVTNACADQITCTVEGTVDTAAVTDEQIATAIQDLPASPTTEG